MRQNKTGISLFKDKVYMSLTSESLNIWTDHCAVFDDWCIPAKRKAGSLQPSPKIDGTFFRAYTQLLCHECH